MDGLSDALLVARITQLDQWFKRADIRTDFKLSMITCRIVNFFYWEQSEGLN